MSKQRGARILEKQINIEILKAHFGDLKFEVLEKVWILRFWSSDHVMLCHNYTLSSITSCYDTIHVHWMTWTAGFLVASAKPAKHHEGHCQTNNIIFCLVVQISHNAYQHGMWHSDVHFFATIMAEAMAMFGGQHVPGSPSFTKLSGRKIYESRPANLDALLHEECLGLGSFTSTIEETRKTLNQPME